MAFLSDDADFYLRVSTTWTFSATAAVAILRGWIRGPGFHPKKSYLVVLVYSLLLARRALSVRMVRGNIPESYQCRHPGAIAAPAVGGCVLVDGAYIWDLVQVADECYVMMLIMGVNLGLGHAIWGRRRKPPRPRVPQRRGIKAVAGILLESLLFVCCALLCLIDLPYMLHDYMAATANRRDSTVA